jgi:hypothetical protein
MLPAPIVLIETDYETLDEAIAAKDDHTAQLDAQGILFRQTTLYRLTDGARVFLITPYDPDLESDEPSRGSSKPRTRRTSTTPQKRRERSQQVDYR